MKNVRTDPRIIALLVLPNTVTHSKHTNPIFRFSVLNLFRLVAVQAGRD
jgi:hypothetical protein